MSEFEYLAIFVSIIFGISVTHILAGVVSSIYRGEKDGTHFVLTAFFFMVLILNWWTGFSWERVEVWSFDLFLIIVIWSVIHYIGAITLYPPRGTAGEQPFEYRRNWFLWTFIAIALMDIVQTGARGALFTPVIYLPYVLHYVAVSLIAIAVNRAGVHRWTAWYFLIVTVIWSFVVRRFLI